ncbi:MAG: oxidoreductase [Emcibacter sp.]|nr:oxidoreductase [Emcibacter sp.]
MFLMMLGLCLSVTPPPYPAPYPMDREAGISAYQDLITPDEYKRRLKAGDLIGLSHEFKIPDGPPPVFQVEITKVESMTAEVTKYHFARTDGTDMPAFDAGAHIDVVVAPEFFRQYSLSSDPSDLSNYQIALLREEDGRGGSKLMHRIFQEGRKIFISPPHNHFPLDETAEKSYLMGGGIGITPMIAMAHSLHKLGKDFELHYSCSSRSKAGFLNDFSNVPWSHKVHLHFSDEGSRVNLEALFADTNENHHIYVCGPERFIAAVLEAGISAGFSEDNLHREYFTTPEAPDYVNHAFRLKLAKSGKDIYVPENKSATDALADAGIQVDVKCSDGLCGVCACGLLDGDVEHRDFVLSKKGRSEKIILCSSRARMKDGVITIDL